MDVAEWLGALGLGQYASAFAENDIDLALLPQLSDADLKELGVASLGHRKRILAAIAGNSPSPAPPDARSASPGERRQVTVLFADLCNFTGLARSLDAEELRDLVGRFTTLVDGIVLSYGGTIDKHIGDAVMALFGAPRAHDDDPLRAARAALDIHEALPRLSEDGAVPLKAHIGIASGEVVAGTVGRAAAQDYTVIGDSVNLAARIVAIAGPGETLLSDGVSRAITGRGHCEELGELSLKGIDTPQRVWRLRDLASEPIAANRSAFVGRQAELAQFAGVVSACLERRIGQVLYVRGEAGIGKTRLVEEMRRRAEAQGFVAHRGLVLDFGVGKGQDPVRALARSLLGLPLGAPAGDRAKAAARVVGEGTVSAEQHVFLGDLLDLPPTGEERALYDAMDNAARNRGKRAVMSALVAEACRGGPTMIIVEDLHWADAQVLGHLAALAGAVRGGPGLLVLTSRIEGDPIDHAWRAGCRDTPVATIDLGPLRREEALTLAGSFIDATQQIALACIERAGGNPLFLEQLLRNAEEGSTDSVPASIQSLVLARMDRLSVSDRHAFQAASVIGQRFGLGVLRRLIGIDDYVCDGLLANALVLPEGDDFLFAHALIQEAAYSSLLKMRRRELHLQAAEWFAESDPVLYAQHLDRADDERAPAAYLAAAQVQRKSYHVEVAMSLVARGLQIAPPGEVRHALACLKGELQRDLGAVAESIVTYREAVAAAPNSVARCQAQLGLADGLRVNEGLDEALALLAEAQKTAEEHDLVPELARVHHLRGNIFFPLGDIAGCCREHENGLVYARRSGSPEAEARALGGLADAAYAQGRMRSAFEHFSRCVELSRENGFGRIEVANRSMVGFSRLYLNEARQAQEDGDAAARAAALVGQPRAELLGETMGMFACCELGDYESMTAYIERTIRIARQLGAKRFEAQGLEFQGRLLLANGRRAEAVEILSAALAMCREAGLRFCGPMVLSALAWAVEDGAERMQLLDEGQELLRNGAVGHNHLWFYRDAIEAMLEMRNFGAVLHYADALEGYTRAEPLPWAQLFAARGRALSRAFEKSCDDTIRRELARIQGELETAGYVAFLPAVQAAIHTEAALQA
jgi:class 3 adenylate cyclase/tetratricopeptide (TPR) repeat protein